MQTGVRQSSGYAENLKHMLRALRGRNYALFFVGQGLSLIGTQTQQVALVLLVWKLTHAEVWLGRIGFVAQIFGVVLAPLAGVLSDRRNRRSLLVATQSLATVQAIVLAVLTLTGHVGVWHIVVLACFLGMVFAVDIPTRQSFVVEMVARREDLPNAIALNSFIFNGARIVGPSIAAAIIVAVGSHFTRPYAGEGACFVINAVSYLAVIVALLAMRLPPRSAVRKHPHVLKSLREGFQHSLGFPPIRNILLMLALVCLVATPYVVLLPAVADKVLHAGREQITFMHVGAWRVQLRLEATTGVLFSSAGAGALLGALFLASRRSVTGLTRLIPFMAAIMGVGMIGFSLVRLVMLSALLLLVVGFGFMVLMASSNTVIQTIVDDDKRGRVMSFHMMAFMGTAPFGSLLAGNLAERIGPAWTLTICGAVLLGAAALFATRLPKLERLIHPIYVRMGIMSEGAPVPAEAARADIIQPNEQTPDSPGQTHSRGE